MFYLLGQRHNNIKTQRVIACVLETNEVTVRDSYNDWLTHFPELFHKKRKISVLLVDYDKISLEITKECLNLQADIHIETATSNDEALEKMEKLKPDVIVCDLQSCLPSGCELLKSLRDKGNKTPFIIFTFGVEKELPVRVYQLGADGFVEKFGNPEVVYQNLKRCIMSVTL